MAQLETNASPTKPTNMVTQRDTLTDTLLQNLVEEESRTAFIALFNHYAPKIKAYMIKGGFTPEEADELAQETMLSVWKSYKKYDSEQSSANTWIFTIARNKRIDAFRKNVKKMPDKYDFEITQTIEKTPEENCNNKEIAKTLKNILEKLPPEQSELIIQSYYNNMTHSDIASATNLPLGTVKSRLRLALAKLKKEMTLTNDDR